MCSGSPACADEAHNCCSATTCSTRACPCGSSCASPAHPVRNHPDVDSEQGGIRAGRTPVATSVPALPSSESPTCHHHNPPRAPHHNPRSGLSPRDPIPMSMPPSYAKSWRPATLLQSSTVQAQVSVTVETLETPALEVALRLAIAAFHP